MKTSEKARKLDRQYQLELKILELKETDHDTLKFR